MKTNEVIAFVQGRIDANNEALVSLQARIENEQSADEVTELKKAQSVIKHRVRFLSHLLSESVASAIASLRVTASQLEEIERDAKSLAKASELFAAIKGKRKISASADDALAQAVAYFVASDFADISDDTLRKNLLSKKSNYTESHTTKRQAQMILNLFTRLNACEKVGKGEFKFTDNAIIRNLSSAYD